MTRTSITDRNETFASSMRAAVENDASFMTFKQLPGIKSAIERLSPARGAEYRAIVLEQTPALLDHLAKFQENDKVGSPDTAPYPEGMMSPTTWRYIKVLSDLQMLFGRLDGWHIAEIGVGYGGQCKMIADLYDVASYTMYDLEPVGKLAEKYLRHVASPAIGKLRFPDFRRLGRDAPETYDLVISNWALSECTREIQDLYISQVLRRSKRGYITYNQISHLYGLDSYRKAEIIATLGFPVELMAEGLTGIPADLENFILHWSLQPLLT